MLKRLGIVLGIGAGIIAGIAGYIGAGILIASFFCSWKDALGIGLLLAYCGIPVPVGYMLYNIIKGFVMLITWIVIGDKKIIKIDEDLIAAQQEIDKEFPGKQKEEIMY